MVIAQNQMARSSGGLPAAGIVKDRGLETW
jgi:hypothetical protein